MTHPNENSISSVARRYGDALISTLEADLPRPFAKLDPLGLSRYVTSLDENRIAAVLRAVLTVHSTHGPHLLGSAATSAPDEVVVLDSSYDLPHPAELSRLLIYAELVIWPDPLLEHPVALRRLVPEDMGAAFRRTTAQNQEALHCALDFYRRYHYAIREGVILPTAWNVAVTMQNLSHQNWLGPAPVDAPWDDLPQRLTLLAENDLIVRPASFDGKRHTVHDGDPDEQCSLIALSAEGDPLDQQRIQVETHMSVVGHHEEDGRFIAELHQGPPSDSPKWIRECRRKFVYNRLVSLRSDTVLATQLGGTVLTRSNTNQRILDAMATPSGEKSAALAIANMSLPTVEGLSVNQIVHARRDAEALQNFRAGFRKACASIKATAGSDSFRSECDAIARDTVERGIHDLRQSYRTLRAKSALDLALSTVLVTLSFAGLSLGQLQFIPAIIGATNQVKSIFDVIPKEAELRRHPYFILWQSSRKPFAA